MRRRHLIEYVYDSRTILCENSFPILPHSPLQNLRPLIFLPCCIASMPEETSLPRESVKFGVTREMKGEWAAVDEAARVPQRVRNKRERAGQKGAAVTERRIFIEAGAFKPLTPG